MKNFPRFTLTFGDHQPPPTTGSRPEIVPCCGGARTTFPVAEGNHHQTVGDDNVGTKLGFSTALHHHQASTSDLNHASNPTALDDHGGEDVTADHIRPPPPQNPTPRWLLPGFFDGVEDDEVDTTLSLWPPGTDTKNSTSTAADIPPPPQVYKWLLPGFFNGVEDDEVDTTLSLRPPGSNNTKKPTSNKRQEPQTSDIPPRPPTPPRWLPAGFSDGGEEGNADKTLSSRPSRTTNDKSRKPREKTSRRREEAAGADIPPPINATPIRWAPPAPTTNNKSRKRSRPNVKSVDEERRSLIPFVIEMRGGAGVEFLYRKRLEESDVSRHQSRLLLTRSEGLMGFLRGDEAAAVGGKGLEIVGVDGRGNVYDKLVMKKWARMDMTVINSSRWKKVVAKNNAQRGDVIEIWGYRENAKSCLAFNFRTENVAAA